MKTFTDIVNTIFLLIVAFFLIGSVVFYFWHYVPIWKRNIKVKFILIKLWWSTKNSKMTTEEKESINKIIEGFKNIKKETNDTIK
jgi:hypothetical protein